MGKWGILSNLMIISLLLFPLIGIILNIIISYYYKYTTPKRLYQNYENISKNISDNITKNTSEFNSEDISIYIMKRERKLNKIIRTINMFLSTVSMWCVLSIILTMNFNNSEYQYRTTLGPFTFGVDGINISLILLMNLLEAILILISFNISGFNGRDQDYKLINLLLLSKFFLNFLFFSLDLFVFFICFELILLPLFLLISRFGSQYLFFLPRLEAAYRFFFYTFIGSLLMLLSIILFYIKYGSSSNELLNFSLGGLDFGIPSLFFFFQLSWFFLFFSFLIKIPMFPFYSWLPYAHSDAPTSGSVLLAGIILKLGSFGILRYSLYIYNPIIFGYNKNLSHIYDYFLPLIFICSYISIILCSLIALRSLFDLKKIIAFSSIVHMNFSIFGFFSNDSVGLFGSTFLMFSHAFISSALFLLVGFLYKRFHTRFLLYFRGLFNLLPLFSFFFLFFVFANLSLPFCSSFLAEFFILFSTFSFNPFLSLFLLLSLFFSTLFFLYFTQRILFGSLSPYILGALRIPKVYGRESLLSSSDTNQRLDTPSPHSGDEGHHKMVSPSVKTLGDSQKTGIASVSLDLTKVEFFSLAPLFLFTLFFTFFPKPFIDLFLLPLSWL